MIYIFFCLSQTPQKNPSFRNHAKKNCVIVFQVSNSQLKKYGRDWLYAHHDHPILLHHCMDIGYVVWHLWTQVWSIPCHSIKWSRQIKWCHVSHKPPQDLLQWYDDNHDNNHQNPHFGRIQICEWVPLTCWLSSFFCDWIFAMQTITQRTSVCLSTQNSISGQN